MKILVLNAGSSSVKYELFDLVGDSTLMSGSIDQIGESSSGVRDHTSAFERIATTLDDKGVRGDELAAVGHRIVHGGDIFSKPVIIDDGVVDKIRDLAPLAPLHNPANLNGIAAARQAFPGLPHIAVFDTAFHSTIPDRAVTYAIPRYLQQDYSIRRYGFHGTSYHFVTARAAEMLGKPFDAANLIAMHLGNGASICAIANGKSIDTSMGFTPLEGLVMGTRAGDIDPAIVLHLQREVGMSVDEVDELLNRESGLLGVCGDSDMRSILQRLEGGDPLAEQALDIFCYRIRKYIGAYYAVLPRVDALVFTAGIGENNPEVRHRICAGLAHLGIELDDARNRSLRGIDGSIDDESSSARVFVVRTNESLDIARQCGALVAAGTTSPGLTMKQGRRVDGSA